MIFGYFRAEPTEYARLSVGGKTVKEGPGISRIYVPLRTSIELVGITLTEKPFGFKETSKDNQELTLQGGLLYRVADPQKVLGEYNFAINPRTKAYLSEDPRKLPDHVLEIARAGARRVVQSTDLEALLGMSEKLSEQVMAGLQESPVIRDLGIEVKTIYFNAPQAQPDIAKALGATYREGLLQKADKATFERRAEAVAQEKAIKRNELRNEIDLEKQRKQLVDLQGNNEKAKAQFDAEAARIALAVYDDATPGKIAALALYKIGEGAENIENLSITTELLTALRNAR